MPSNEDSLLDLVSTLIDKMTETQSSTTSVMSDFKNTIEEMRKENEELHEQNDKIIGLFQNGFRSEFKEYVDKKADEQTREIEKALYKRKDEIIESVDSFKKIGFWLKLFMLFTIGVGTISAVAYRFVEMMPK